MIDFKILFFLELRYITVMNKFEFRIDKYTIPAALFAFISGRGLFKNNDTLNSPNGHSLRGYEFNLDQVFISNKILALLVCLAALLLMVIRLKKVQ